MGIFEKLERQGWRPEAQAACCWWRTTSCQRESIAHLIGDDDIEVVAVERGEQALKLLERPARVGV